MRSESGSLICWERGRPRPPPKAKCSLILGEELNTTRCGRGRPRSQVKFHGCSQRTSLPKFIDEALKLFLREPVASV